MYFPDLTPYRDRFAPQHYGPELTRAHIGWLDLEHPFPTAEPSNEFLHALNKLIMHPVRIRRGFHECPFCRNAAGGAEIDVVGPSTIYTAPILIAHYVQLHHYSPPEEFVRAAIRQAEKAG